ncbi:hypothetical protein B9Z55_015289 [Caenorhabditis nigoni]|uniref:SGNH domain-containing protein n=1 Tax=Caenorhabditis nigoni TaxID=1611254 RepID=A0A2G5U9I3_9PELO|nr:hypothetical protein B9Z55_015289 [Caenorhabditis nigoni]
MPQSKRKSVFQNLPGTGKYKIVIFGNSWAANHATMIYQECGGKAKVLLQGSAKGCEPLYPTKFSDSQDLTEKCKGNFTYFEERIRQEQPDYAFLLTRFFSIADPMTKSNIQDDPVYKIMKTQMLKFIKNIKYKLYILDALPRHHRKIFDIVPLLKNYTAPEKIDKLMIKPDNFEMARKRHAQLIKDCNLEIPEKCVLVDYKPEFFNESTNTYRYFDEKGISYWTQGHHLSPHGIEHVRHVWTDICRKL